MKLKLKGFFNLFTREAGLIAKDKNIIMIVLIAPVFYSFFYTTIYLNKSESDVKLAVVDLDHSAYSRELTEKLDAHQLVDVSYICANIEEAKQLLNKFDIQGYVVISKDYEREIKRGKGAYISIFLNTSRFLVSNDLNRGINETVMDINDGIKVRFYRAAGFTNKQIEELKEPIRGELKTLFNISETYGDFLLPGFLILILQQTLLIGLSESVAKERENNTLKQLFSLSHKSTNAFIFGKIAFYMMLFTVYALFFFTANFSVLKLVNNGSLILLMLVTILFLFAVSFAGVFAASFFKTKLMALQVLAFSTYPVFFLTGFSFPFHSLPQGYQYLGELIPTTPYLAALKKITNAGAGLDVIMPHIWHLLILASLFYILARIRMRLIILKHK